jgi:hypothetical protein
MSNANKIPYVGYGNTDYITQDVAEKTPTADYWRKRFFLVKDCLDNILPMFEANLEWQKTELKQLLADKKTDNRIIWLLSVVCLIETIFLIGGAFI